MKRIIALLAMLAWAIPALADFGNNGGNYGSALGSGTTSGVVTNLPVTVTNFVVVASNGNDTTATNNSYQFPAATITKAIALLATNNLTGGTMVFLPGDFTSFSPGAASPLVSGQSLTVIATGSTITNSSSGAGHPLFSLSSTNEYLHIIGGNWNMGGTLASPVNGGSLVQINSGLTTFILDGNPIAFAGYDFIHKSATINNGTNLCIVNGLDLTYTGDFIFLAYSSLGTNSQIIVKNTSLHSYSTSYPVAKVLANGHWLFQNCRMESYANQGSGISGILNTGSGTTIEVANCSAYNGNGATNWFINASGGGTVTLDSPLGSASQFFNDGTSTIQAGYCGAVNQGTTNLSAATSFTASFKLTFPDTNYTATASGNGFALAALYVSAKTTTNCVFNMTAATGNIDWQAIHQ